MRRHELTDEQWARVQRMLPTRRGPKSKRGDRDFVNAVLWFVKTGVPWRDLPERFGNWKTVFNRFSSWSRRGVWKKVFKELQLDTGGDVTLSILDASVVRAHQDAAGGKGGSKPMLLAVLEVGSPRKSTPSSTPMIDRSRSKSRPASNTRPRSPRTSSRSPKATRASAIPATTPRRSERPSELKE